MSQTNKNKSWKIWIFSLLAASIFWAFNKLGNNFNYKINYPIEFIYNEDSLIAIQKLPEHIRLDVSGIGWDFFRQNFLFRIEPVKVELADPVSTKFLTSTSLLPTVTEQLSQFEINFLLIDTIFIHLETRQSKVVHLMVDSIQIDMETDYRITSSVVVSPDTARVYGPKTFIDTLSNDYIIMLPSKEIDKPYDRFVGLGLPNINGTHSKPSTVNVTFEVERFEKIELPLTIKRINFPKNAKDSLEKNQILLHFNVKYDLRETFSETNFQITANYEHINRKDSTLPLTLLVYPEEAIDIQMVPDTLKVIYE